jgi:hypothetical protein
MRGARRLLCVAAPLAFFCACATLPVGPSVTVLPGAGKDFGEFRDDDDECRAWADDRVGVDARHETAARVARGAVIGAAAGAAVGAAIGAAEGRPATGAAVGASAGAAGGLVGGAANASRFGGELQRRYDAAYTQCMYALGNQVPVARGSFASAAPPPPPPRRPIARRAIPPPPPGDPPPPPPHWSN